MDHVTFKGEQVKLGGTFPNLGVTIPDFTLANKELKDLSLDTYNDCNLLLLNIFPSIDTSVCADSVRRFNSEAASFEKTKVLCISKDLPFAQARFCGAENIENVETLSAFRNLDFAKQFGVDILDSILAGLLTRAVIIIDKNRKVLYTELVQEITNKPDYEKCLTAMRSFA